MRAGAVGWLVAGMMGVVGAAHGQDADLTILVDGALLEHGGVVEVTAGIAPSVDPDPQTITLSDRYAQVTLRYPEGASFAFRFRPVPDVALRPGLELFQTQLLTIGGQTIDGPDGPREADVQTIRVLPFAEYGDAEPANRISAAWGTTQRFADPPPANIWGARALPWVFDTFGDRRIVRMICADQASVSVCTPDPADALLLEALWWRAIAEGRLEQMRFDALRACYDGDGQPAQCESVAGDGWPTYVPGE